MLMCMHLHRYIVNACGSSMFFFIFPFMHIYASWLVILLDGVNHCQVTQVNGGSHDLPLKLRELYLQWIEQSTNDGNNYIHTYIQTDRQTVTHTHTYIYMHTNFNMRTFSHIYMRLVSWVIIHLWAICSFIWYS